MVLVTALHEKNAHMYIFFSIILMVIVCPICAYSQFRENSGKIGLMMLLFIKDDIPKASKLSNLMKSKIDQEKCFVLEDKDISQNLKDRLEQTITSFQKKSSTRKALTDSYSRSSIIYEKFGIYQVAFQEKVSLEGMDILQKLGIQYIVVGYMHKFYDYHGNFWILAVDSGKTECTAIRNSDFTLFTARICWEVLRKNGWAKSSDIADPNSLINRRVYFGFISSSKICYSFSTQQPKITINNADVSENPITLKPGTYHMVAELPGHYPVSRDIEVEPIELIPLDIRIDFEAKKRSVLLNVKNSTNNQLIAPDVCKCGEMDIPVQKFFEIFPGSYETYIYKTGYKPLKKWILIRPDDIPLTIEEYLEVE